MKLDPGATCGVCKQSLADERLEPCPGCGTRYHRGCWIYNDRRCAVYGCAQARAERDPLPSLRPGYPPAVPERPPRPTGCITLIVIVVVGAAVLTAFGVWLSRRY